MKLKMRALQTLSDVKFSTVSIILGAAVFSLISETDPTKSVANQNQSVAMS